MLCLWASALAAAFRFPEDRPSATLLLNADATMQNVSSRSTPVACVDTCAVFGCPARDQVNCPVASVTPAAALFIGGWGGSSTRYVVSLLMQAGLPYRCVVGELDGSSALDSSVVSKTALNDLDIIYDRLNASASQGLSIVESRASVKRAPSGICEAMAALQDDCTVATGSWIMKEPRLMYWVPHLKALMPSSLYLHVVTDIRRHHTFHVETSPSLWLSYFGGRTRLTEEVRAALWRVSESRLSSNSSHVVREAEALAGTRWADALASRLGPVSRCLSCKGQVNEFQVCHRDQLDADTALLMATGWNHVHTVFARQATLVPTAYMVVRAEDMWDAATCRSVLADVLERIGAPSVAAEGAHCGDSPHTPKTEASPLGELPLEHLTAVVAPALGLLGYR